MIVNKFLVQLKRHHWWNKKMKEAVAAIRGQILMMLDFFVFLQKINKRMKHIQFGRQMCIMMIPQAN
jgi:hypothetical protein